jgi:hypothetical protein
LSFRSALFVIPQRIICHSAAHYLSFRSALFVIPQRIICHSERIICHSAAHYLSFRALYLSFRSEAEESAFSRCSMVYTIT